MSDPIATSSLSASDRSRKYVALVLQAMQEPGRQVAAATAMGMSESTVSRLKNEHLNNFALLLAHLGLKIVPAHHVCVNRNVHELMYETFKRAMADKEVAQKIIWEDE